MEDNYPSPMTSSWEEINEWARNFLRDFPQFEDNINEHRLKEPYINSLSQIITLKSSNFWLSINPKEFCGRSNLFFTKIDIHPLLSGYERDKTLFHELCHLHYDGLIYPFLEDKFPYQRGEKYRNGDILEDIIEWLGRKHRADYILLREAIHSFQLEPQIYDLPSYLAFAQLFLNGNIKINNKDNLFRVLKD